MPFAVLPALIPEITPVYDVYFAAFKNEKIMEYLYPGGVDRQAHKHGTTLWLHHDQNGYTIKVVDSDTGAVVGMAQWEVFWRPGKDTLWKKPKGAEWLKGDKRTKAETVLIPNWNMREKLFGGRKHVYCVTMATHPDYQRKGIGRLLVQWGIDIAEQLGLPVYLESTEQGAPLYEAVGFEKLAHEKLVYKASETGQKEDIEVPLMVKMPSKANGLSYKAWADKGYPESY
ncbi:putative N-acetyltransferase domain-containing protein [Seiridium cardinale]|uniref:N-acetyltransferase domain-containing protein n=1 Tax=Seiridium cardinale TaxID=138064 RepID=A0ABR2XEJ9_9PEZI